VINENSKLFGSEVLCHTLFTRNSRMHCAS